MTVKPNNLIQIPPTYHIKIVLTIDPHTQQSELKIERGKITNLQLATVLLEHATHINRQLMIAESVLNSSKPIVTPDGGNNVTA